jgi:hypothetical protein
MKVGIKTAFAAGLAALALGVVAVPANADTGDAAKRGKCDLSQSEYQGGLGASYTYTLSVSNTSCSKGKKVVKAFHACRKDNGGWDGRCKSRVEGFKCKEGKRSGASSNFNSKVVCTKGSKTVKSKFGMNK